MGVYKLTRSIVLFIVFLLATTAQAQLLHGVTDALSGGGAVGPSCTLALKFNLACNSQYATVIHF